MRFKSEMRRFTFTQLSGLTFGLAATTVVVLALSFVVPPGYIGDTKLATAFWGGFSFLSVFCTLLASMWAWGKLLVRWGFLTPEEARGYPYSAPWLKKPLSGVVFVALLSTVSGCDLYQSDAHEFSELSFSHGRDSVQVRLRGDFHKPNSEVTIQGNPYYLLIRHLTPDNDSAQVELEWATMRRVRGSTGELVGQQTAKAVDDDFHFSSVPEALVRDRYGNYNWYAAFLFENLELEYDDYEISGCIHVHRNGRITEVPFGGILKYGFRSEKRSKLWDGLMGI